MTVARKLKALPGRDTAVKRVACYCRKSTTKGLDSTFNSLDNQLESVLGYVQSRKPEGWMLLEHIYQDGGYSGGTVDRPEFQRLLRDVRAGEVDVVIVQRIDRISRSLVDFSGIIAEFEKNGVEFHSVTQQFSTTSSMGQFAMNILMSFAQLERQLIAERTREKMSAARRRGLWCGGTPPYGYRVENKRLAPDPELADRLREIFDIYLGFGSIRRVVDAINGRGWQTRKGRPWTTATVSSILKNVAYIGMTRTGDEVVDGEHEGLIDPEVFRRVQARLSTNGHRGGAAAKNKHHVLLRGILHCGSCGAEMAHTYTSKGNRRYHYYRCPTRHNDGSRCPEASIALGEIERFVVGKIGEIGRDPEMLDAIVSAAHEEVERQRPAIQAEQQQVRREQTALTRKRQRLVDAIADAGAAEPALRAEIGVIKEQAASIAERADALDSRLQGLDQGIVDAEEVTRTLRDFDGTWRHLEQPERERLLRLVFREVRWHGADGEAELVYREGFER
jgi:site-specific DNA recombinase